MANLNLHVIKGDTELAQSTYEQLRPVLNSSHIAEVQDPRDADDRFVLGGDGTALTEGRQDLKIEGLPPIFGMKAGNLKSKGMFLNEIPLDISTEQLAEIIRNSIAEKLYYLHVTITDIQGRTKEIYALNDVNTIRTRPQSTALDISINGIKRAERAMGDGFIISTPQGSTAYNRSAGGIIATSQNTMQLRGICSSFGSLMLNKSDTVGLTALETQKRPQRVEADGQIIIDEMKDLVATTSQRFSTFCFRQGQTLEDKLIAEAVRK